MSENNHYDIIIIGSGIGALTLASIMAKINNKRVLILERHSKIGGYTHSFSRKKYTWDVGLHFVGRTFEKKLPGVIFKFITGGKLKWENIPEPFETFLYPDFSFEVHNEGGRFQRDLIEMFPAEEKAIRKYFKDVQSIYNWFARYFLCRFLPVFLRIPVMLFNVLSHNKALSTTEHYLRHRFKDEKLKTLLTSQWGNYGLPPSQSAFIVHAIVVNHCILGGCYPEGGSKEIARTIVPGILEHGGKCMVNHEVTRLIVKNNRAAGVRVSTRKKSGMETKEFFAPVVVSNAGVYNTYSKFIPDDVHIPFLKKCVAMSKSSACVTLYVGLKDDAANLGIGSANVWIHTSHDHEKNFLNAGLLEGKPSSCYLSTMFMKDFKVKTNTAVIIAYADYSEFEKWKLQVSGKRDRDYYDLKKKITTGLVNLVESRYPGFRRKVDFMELATPLTSEHYMAHPEGTMYGLPATPERYRQSWMRVKTPVKGFYITGADVSSMGVVSSLLGGFAAACVLNGPFGLFKLMTKIRRRNRKI